MESGGRSSFAFASFKLQNERNLLILLLLESEWMANRELVLLMIKIKQLMEKVVINQDNLGRLLILWLLT